ncbi:MAG: bifunctional phosphoglucose/phosphomannose isomerase [Candidatus Parcubacteria bacterium]|nr:MAG: bifunctional phosphoglucose/phosphomannose isomerase [Candidatus Parcubacteria bacterium]
MNIYEAIKNFNQQFDYEPKIENEDKLKSKFSKFVIGGMGGSNLASDLLKIRDPYLDILIHRNYGLPKISENDLRERLLIANSYSGNTEETIDFLLQAISKNLNLAVVSTDGKSIELAKEYNLPYIQMPDIGLQPRSALGFNLKAIVKLIGRSDLLKELDELKDLLKPEEFEEKGKELAEKIKGYIPIIYSSAENICLAYNWKIKFNETSKIPAFYNVFPELNHNEMAGFSIQHSSADFKELIEKFYFIILKDKNDHPRIQKRMEVFEKLFTERGFQIEIINLEGVSVFHKIFNSLILADWTSYYLALYCSQDPEKVPLIEEFKNLIK